MKLQLAYETSFKEEFGSKVSKHLNAIMQHAIGFYKHTSLATKINITPGNFIDAGNVPTLLPESCSNTTGLT